MRAFLQTKTLKKARENIKPKLCRDCNKACIAKELWISASVLGKEYDRVCKHRFIYMLMPDTEATECAKIVVKNRCEDIIAG